MKGTSSVVLMLSAGLACNVAQAGLKEEVAAKEGQVSALRTAVDAIAKPLIVNGSDIRVFFSTAPLASAVSSLNARPVEGRKILIRSTSPNGKFWEDGETFCNSFAELNSNDGFKADAVLSNFSATMRPDGAIDLGTRVSVNGSMQVHVHFRGIRVYATLLGRRVGGGACPPGGGAGTSIGVGFDKTKDLVMRLSFAPVNDEPYLAYTAQFTAPDKIDVTAQINLGTGFAKLPTIGHPLDFDLPHTPLASGKLPLLFGNQGEFKLPDGSSRSYSVMLSPKSFVADGRGITASWISTVQFKP